MTPDELFKFLRKPDRYTPEDLQQLREGLFGASAAFARTENHVWLSSRLSVETLTSLAELNLSLRKLDQDSSNLITTTNKLTAWILGLTVAAAFLGVIQLLVAALQWRR